MNQRQGVNCSAFRWLPVSPRREYRFHRALTFVHAAWLDHASRSFDGNLKPPKDWIKRFLRNVDADHAPFSACLGKDGVDPRQDCFYYRTNIARSPHLAS
jgi:hypothetical protein